MRLVIFPFLLAKSGSKTRRIWGSDVRTSLRLWKVFVQRQ